MNDDLSLAGRVALVTGSSRGIGFAIAERLGRQGATVVLNGRDAARLEEKRSALSAAGIAADARVADIASEEQISSAIRGIVSAYDRLDILVNNAGIIVRRPLVETGAEAWDEVIDCNLSGTFFATREAARAMIDRGYGRIINIGSILSLIGRKTIHSYVATKHAIAGLTKSLAAELGPFGITCNAIAPGYIRTEINQALQDDTAFDHMVRTRTPVGRWGETAEIAGPVAFLASSAASYINGHVLVVDGGMIETI